MGVAPKPKAPVDPAKAQAAKEAAAKKLADKVAADQKWLDAQTKNMTPEQKQEVFNQLSKSCSGTTMSNGQITLACPIKARLTYCMPGDPFTCANGKVGGGGCKLSNKVSDALAAKGTKIDGVFTSREEGGSYLSPYVPWGPISGKNGKPVITKGNSSGVTIGTGVDLGAVKDPDAYLADLEARGVSKQTRDAIKPLLGKKREAACEALRDARGGKPLLLDAADVELIDQQAMESRAPALRSSYNKKVKLARAGYDKQIAAEGKKVPPDQAKIDALTAKRDGLKDFDSLDGREQSTLFSTYYHEGSISSPASQSYVDSAMAGDSNGERAALVAKSKSSNSVIAARGLSELGYHDSHPPPPVGGP